jgi:aerobic carbon-monoxide dehydrogenase medium subunit
VTATSLEAAQIIAPTSRAEAVAAFGDGSGVTVLGGGTILMPELNYGRLRPERVLLLQNAGLSGIARDGTSLTVGAMTTVAELEQAPEPLGTAARNVADHEIRAQATLGGNLCASAGGATPRGDLQAALIALDARVKTAGEDGERTEPIEDFLAAPNERLLLEVEFEEPQRSGYAAAHRPHAHAYTILAVCAAETSAGVRVGLSGAGPTGLRARSVEDALVGGASPEEASQKALDNANMQDDALASAWYRQRLLPILVHRALDDLGGGK